jgi:hypothetical protein
MVVMNKYRFQIKYSNNKGTGCGDYEGETTIAAPNLEEAIYFFKQHRYELKFINRNQGLFPLGSECTFVVEAVEDKPEVTTTKPPKEETREALVKKYMVDLLREAMICLYKTPEWYDGKAAARLEQTNRDKHEARERIAKVLDVLDFDRRIVV